MNEPVTGALFLDHVDSDSQLTELSIEGGPARHGGRRRDGRGLRHRAHTVPEADDLDEDRRRPGLAPFGPWPSPAWPSSWPRSTTWS